VILRQTWAIFLEAYRELSARKLFWIVLAISGLVVVALGVVGINEKGITLAGHVVLPGVLTTAQIPRDSFYKFLFASIGVPIWLTWAATILALVSTAGVIPDMLQAGAIDVALSKPISRARLYLTKYLSALLFAALQVVVFSVASFLVIGLRGESWEWKVFLAIPLVVCFFSYIYSVCALVGLLTRSTMTALLAAIGFWGLVFAVHTTETIYLTVRTSAELRVTALEADVRAREERLSTWDEAGAREAREMEGRAAAPDAGGDVAGVDEPRGPTLVETDANGVRVTVNAGGRRGRGVLGTIADAYRPTRTKEVEQAELERARKSLEESREALTSRTKGHRIALAVKTVLPKTSETMGILQRELVSMSELAAMANPGDEDVGRYVPAEGDEDYAASFRDQRAAQETVERLRRDRSAWWIIGTSLLFEALIVGLSARVFSRRDF